MLIFCLIHHLPAKDGEEMIGLAERQNNDNELRPIIEYLKNGNLPIEEKVARELTLNKKQYVLMDDILYHLVSDCTLRVVTPREDRTHIIEEDNDGKLSGHLRDAKDFKQISKSFWWPGMRKEVMLYCRSCEKCASRHVGKPIRPPLTPIPVKGPFDRVGVDLIKFPCISKGNKYAVVFMIVGQKYQTRLH